MLDLGTSFLASVARDPRATAIVDSDTRLSYLDWFAKISGVVAGLDGLGIKPGDHLVSILQNRWEAAADSIAKAVVFEPISAAAILQSAKACSICRITVGAEFADQHHAAFSKLVAIAAKDALPRVDPEATSLMLYTSGTTSKPKGVPRRHRVERAAAIAHVAQNLYGRGERTLGVMPLYHTMGVRSLLSMSLVGGTFVCLPRYNSEAAITLIQSERISNLYLVPTLYHDILHHPSFSDADLSSVRKLGFAGASMTDGLLQKLDAAFKPDLFVNHYGCSEIYTFTVEQNAVAKPGSAGKAGINQLIKVVKLNADSAADSAAIREEGEIIALLAGDESFDGYWRRPAADKKALRGGWYFTGDTGFVDADGDLFVTGRVDDMIITGGENVSPVEIESCLSLHPAVSEVAVVGLPDERWGKIVTAFIRRRAHIASEDLDEHCRRAGLPSFKRPRRFVFVSEIPKSPVGKLLRRKLVAGEYDLEINI
jgi:2-furoate---CoA ligase